MSAEPGRRAERLLPNEEAAVPGQEAVLAEANRVRRTVLQPRGLDERRILLVGGAGYIGCELTAQLLDAGYQVRTVDLLIYGHGVAVTGFLRNPHYEFRRLDLVATETLSSALDAIPGVIGHGLFPPDLVADVLVGRQDGRVERLGG